MLKKKNKNNILRHFIIAFISSVIIVLLVFWWLKIYTKHGEKIETPNFKTLTVNEAKKLATNKHLQLIIDSVFMPGVAKGTIFLQNPIAHSDSTNSWVKPNRKIYLTSVRNDIQTIKIPNIDDVSEMVLIPRLEGRFIFEKKYTSGDPNKVLKVEYKGKKVKTGDLLPRGSKLKLYIGQAAIKKPVALPKLTGLTLEEANTKISNKSLTINAIIYNGCTTTEDSISAIITKQTPEFIEGRNILEGKEIMVILNKKGTFSTQDE